MKDSITSLCYVSKRNEKSVELCRIADYYDDHFESYMYDSNRDFYETERDLIYGSAYQLPADIGSVGVYEWSVYQDASNSWKTETQCSTLPWVEVVQSNCPTPKDIVKIIKDGWKSGSTFDKLHDLIICCSGSTQSLPAIYLPKEFLKLSGELLTFSDDVFTVEYGYINIADATNTCHCRYSKEPPHN